MKNISVSHPTVVTVYTLLLADLALALLSRQHISVANEHPNNGLPAQHKYKLCATSANQYKNVSHATVTAPPLD